MALTRNSKAYMLAVLIIIIVVIAVPYVAEGSPVQKLEQEHKRSGHRFGPMLGYVQRAKDGDTYEVLLMTFPGEYRLVDFRLRDVDTPEIRHAMCAEEREAGESAKVFAEKLFAETDSIVFVHAVERDGGFGRFAGSIVVGRGEDLAALLLEAGHARPAADAEWLDGFFCEQLEGGEQ